MNWRQIEAALQDYFGGVNDGDVFAEVEAVEFLADTCDDCPANGATVELINLTELAKHIAGWVGSGA